MEQSIYYKKITPDHKWYDLKLKEVWRYRDLVMLVGFGLQLWQYASPIAYGLELVPLRYRALYMLNPITPIITTFRYSVFGFGFFDWTFYLISWGVTLLLFFIGLVLFSRIERTFMDTI